MKLKMGLAASLFLLVGGAFWAGCGGNACDDAVDHFASCVKTSVTATGDTETDCSGVAACEADCINAASCDTLNGKDAKGIKALADCDAKCASGS